MLTETPDPPAVRAEARARSGRPNILLVVLDDLGFSDFGCYGSSIATPTVDWLAGNGVRFNNFHVTPLCAPTRAALLTGRNHHAVDMGMLPELPSDRPGYRTRIPDSAGTLARVLQESGYATSAIGKWHLTPRDACSAAGPHDRWPLGMGFDSFYGFLMGTTDQWVPDLVRDTTRIDPPSLPDEGYHLTEDLADEAIGFVRRHAESDEDRPFFLYFAPAAVHIPHQAPPRWIEEYRGKFAHGWDEERRRRLARQIELGLVPAGTQLTALTAEVPPWDEVPDDARLVYQRQMEAYAGFLTHTDAQLGRVVEALRESDQLENTIVVVLADNGAAGGHANGQFDTATRDIPTMLERLDDFGGPESFPHYATGWAVAGNTPFRFWKAFTWLGGIRSPLIVHWPERLGASAEVRDQFTHAVDIMPTLLDAAGARVPAELDGHEQQPIDGASFLSALADASAPPPRSTQYFEMAGSRALYHDGWMATTDHVPAADHFVLTEGSRDFAEDRWHLYDLDHDYSQAHDRATGEPERLERMIELWGREAERNTVLPLDDRFFTRPSGALPPAARYPDAIALGLDEPWSDVAAPFSRSFRLEAAIRRPAGAPLEGVIATCYRRTSGTFAPHPAWTCFASRGDVVLVVNGPDGRTMLSTAAPTHGEVHVTCIFERLEDGNGRFTLTVDGGQGADAVLTLPTTGPIDAGSLLVGRDRGHPEPDYRPPFRLNGEFSNASLTYS